MNAHVNQLSIAEELQQRLASWDEAARILATQCQVLAQREVAVDLCRRRLCEAELIGFRKGVSHRLFLRGVHRPAPWRLDWPSAILSIMGGMFVIIAFGFWVSTIL